MNTSNPEIPTETVSVEPQPNDNRRRLRELLSIPERDRSDEIWDEIIELEIQLAPGNRISDNGGGQGHVRGTPPQGKPGGGIQKKRRTRTNSNNRRPRQNKPSSGGNAS